MLHPGTPAPDFTLPDADMELVKLSQYKGRKVVLYFYPRDDTPCCTQEAIEFSDLEEEFAANNAVVIGVSKDDCMRHATFRDKHGLAVGLLSDVDCRVCEKYGVWQEKENDGVRRMCIVRSTFIIDKHGTLRYAFHDVPIKGHAAEMLKLIKDLK
jgi:peroxiredoxin Q/BCP